MQDQDQIEGRGKSNAEIIDSNAHMDHSTDREESPGHVQPSEAPGDGLLTPNGGLNTGTGSIRPRLQTKASTAVSYTDIYTQPQPEPSPSNRPSWSRPPSTMRNVSYAERLGSRRASIADDNASIKSFRSTQSFAPDHTDNVESLLGDTLSPQSLRHEPNDDEPLEYGDIFSALASEDAEFRELFRHEFDELEDVNAGGSNEGIIFWTGRPRGKSQPLT